MGMAYYYCFEAAEVVDLGFKTVSICGRFYVDIGRTYHLVHSFLIQECYQIPQNIPVFGFEAIEVGDGETLFRCQDS